MTPTPESTEPPSQLRTDLPPVRLKYVPLPAPLPALDDNDAAVVTMTATEDLRPPCRRCLLDAAPGEPVRLLAYDPFPPGSVTPYRGAGPVFVHARACAPFAGGGGDRLPDRQLRRLMSARAYDARHMMLAAELVDGADQVDAVVGGMLADRRASYVHLHNAKPGCFAVRVERA